MSEENVEIVRRSFEAWNEGGVEASRALGWTEDAEWHDPPGFPDAGVHRGADAVAARLGELLSLLPHRVEIDDAIAVGDGVVLRLSFHGRGGESGAPVEQQMSCVVQVRDGKICRWRPYLSYEEALRAAGLRE